MTSGNKKDSGFTSFFITDAENEDLCPDSAAKGRSTIVDDVFVVKGNTLEKYLGTDIYVAVPGNVTEIGREAFKGCDTVRTVRLPSTVTKIAASAFEQCSTLVRINLPFSLVCIEEKAFMNCVSLSSIELHDNLREIGKNVFFGCENLIDIYCSNDSLLTPEVFGATGEDEEFQYTTYKAYCSCGCGEYKILGKYKSKKSL